jgi:hypothetical protein
MNRTLRIQRSWLAGLLGAAVLTGSPLVAQADQGKWWNPKEGGPTRERRVERQVRTPRGNDRGVHRGWRYARPQFQRDYVVIRNGYRAPSYRARRVYARPYYIERQQLCVIRPVRYFVAASAVIGGVQLRARFHDNDRYYYGCNFCDARFGGYDAYRAHVLHCDNRPSGYRFEVSDWDADWNNEACDVDGCEVHGGHHANWDDDHGDRYDDGYQDDDYR